jgi:hypothetical protein
MYDLDKFRHHSPLRINQFESRILRTAQSSPERISSPQHVQEDSILAGPIDRPVKKKSSNLTTIHSFGQQAHGNEHMHACRVHTKTTKIAKDKQNDRRTHITKDGPIF